MSKFAYKAEGELNSDYVLDLLKEYLNQMRESNNTNVNEVDYKINPNSNRFARWFRDFSKRLFKNKSSLENYNKVLTLKYLDVINEKLDIYTQTNVLT
ncbi:MAG: hypothetical protein ACLRFE_00985, partial [Clostridia bacterium]